MEHPVINTWTGDQASIDSCDASVRALMGWEGIVIRDPEVDPVDLLDAYLKRTAAESCGQCIPCRLGTAQLVDLMDDIVGGRGSEKTLEQIRFLVLQISRTARCDIGRTMAKPVVDLMDNFQADFLAVINNERPVRRGSYASVVTAPCISACPSNVDIPAYLENVRMDRWSQAMATVRADCPMPGTIGRVCVRPCETHCRRSRLDEPLAIRAVKRFLADEEMAAKLDADTPPPPAKPGRVAVIGAGPAGLSCAYYLGKQGYRCTIFEAQEGPGGMAAYGIPSYRLPRQVIAHEVAMVEKQGAEIRYGIKVGEDIRLDELLGKGYGAVFLAVGAPESSKMRCEGEDAGYRCFMTGVNFLAEAARGRTPLSGKRLVVIGGGNVAMDCVRTARRIGFDDVNLLYRRTEAEMPADPQEIEEAKEEGVHFHHLVAPVSIVADGEEITGLKCQRMELGEPDASGRRRPVPVQGSEFVIDCDTIIPAVGQVCVVDCVLPEEDALTPWKTLVVDQTTFQSETSHIFGGGDCVTGPATLIKALAAGKHAARFIAEYLEAGQCTGKPIDILRKLITPDTVCDPQETFAYPGQTLRAHPEIMAPDVRIGSFDEVEKGFSAAQARVEAARCLRCYRLMLSAI
ncbi:NADPH-Fe(3+) oxidoreductase subunit beta [Desulfosarcina ovata subsp. sediminis]|uniref:NADPH-Fe(3+) oxidoreductase subunit beta n=2 Tax=Desulfosarcina ovata TaxID=83564 RepID=A0A5K7ZW86_9BACT|nr:NADPH-Fe(3+) oxidoreductase subunit beta [Desulfosarcina ovata subsp. sediminis]